MALIAVSKPKECLLKLDGAGEELYEENHILEPEFHQEKYVSACKIIAKLPNAFQLGDTKIIKSPLHRGLQPVYADDEADPASLQFEGMITDSGTILQDKEKKLNVCALTSACIRRGFIDTGLARSVTRKFYEKAKNRAAVEKHDVLINSTGDGTIGRVAVYDFDFPAIVDGHVTIVRLKRPEMAWYIAASLLSENGQLQMYRYINGSSGQVELYPQDLGRLWIRPATETRLSTVAKEFSQASRHYRNFYVSMQKALSNAIEF